MEENRIELCNVHEYCEEYPVYFEYNAFINSEMAGPRDIVIAKNEGGYNYTWVDAYELFLALKSIYERD